MFDARGDNERDGDGDGDGDTLGDRVTKVDALNVGDTRGDFVALTDNDGRACVPVAERDACIVTERVEIAVSVSLSVT